MAIECTAGEISPYPMVCEVKCTLLYMMSGHCIILTSVCCGRDDAVFDDALVELFPRYWDMTPRDFDFVFVGHIIPGQPVREPTVEGEAASLQPHGMIQSSGSALQGSLYRLLNSWVGRQS